MSDDMQQQQQQHRQVDSSSTQGGVQDGACAPRKHVLLNSSSSSKGIDYSKWDKIGDESEEDEAPRAPRVRRLSRNQSVTVGPAGLEIHASPAAAAAATARQQQQQLQQWIEEERQEELEEAGMSFEDAHEWPRCGAVQVGDLQAAAAAAADAAAAAAGAAAVLASGIGDTELRSLIRNGDVSVKEKFFWSQTATEVSFSLALPCGVRGRDLRVHLTADTLRIACTNKYFNSSSSSGDDEVVLLEGSFPHPVEEDEASWIWEVTERRIDWQRLQKLAQQQQQQQGKDGDTATADSSSSSSGGELLQLEQQKFPLAAFFLDLQLRKKKIIQGTDVWWPCILKGTAGIDVTQLTDRRRREATKSFKAAWEAAHTAFKAKVKQQQNSKLQHLLADAANTAAADAQEQQQQQQHQKQ
ncbi:hypothetical protein Esti_003848 [Eimeria stiedai]